MYALDPITGETRWRYDLDTATDADPTVSGDVVLIGDRNGRIHAVSRESGARLWITEEAEPIFGNVSSDGNGVFVAHKDGRVTAVDLRDGSPLWQFAAAAPIYGGTTVLRGVVFITSHDDWVYALDAASGELQWKTELLLGSNSTPLVQRELVMVGSWDERMYALNSWTGEHIWNFWAGGAVPASATVSGDSVYFGSHDGHLYSVSRADGSLKWRYEIGGEIWSTPAVADGLVYVGAEDSAVYALDAKTGSLVWRLQTGGEVNQPLTLSHNTVYAASDDGSVYALRAGFPDGFEPEAVEPTPQPAFELMTPREMKQWLTTVFGSNSPMSRMVNYYGADGKTVEKREGTGLIIEIFENGYYLLTGGRTVQQDGWETHYYSVEDFNALADEREDPELRRVRTRGWCCIRTEDGLALIMRANSAFNESIAVTAHEAGHALQRLINPVQSKSPRHSLIGALREAEAYTFEVALVRKIGEYVDVETARWPSGNYNWGEYLAQWRQVLEESVEDPTREHARGLLLMWQAVLHDPDLAHLRAELRRNGHVSADSLMDMYHRFVSLTPSEVDPYIESITVESLSDDLNFILSTVLKRTGFSIDFPELVLNVPTLVTSP